MHIHAYTRFHTVREDGVRILPSHTCFLILFLKLWDYAGGDKDSNYIIPDRTAADAARRSRELLPRSAIRSRKIRMWISINQWIPRGWGCRRKTMVKDILCFIYTHMYLYLYKDIFKKCCYPITPQTILVPKYRSNVVRFWNFRIFFDRVRIETNTSIVSCSKFSLKTLLCHYKTVLLDDES